MDEGDDAITPDIEEAVAALPGLDDATLWQVAKESHLSLAESREVEKTHFKRGRGERLTDAEKQRLAYLLHQSDKTLLVRAEALALLKERGIDISPLLQLPRGRHTQKRSGPRASKKTKTQW